MVLDRLLADEHLLRHFLVLEALGYQPDDLALPLAERRTLAHTSVAGARSTTVVARAENLISVAHDSHYFEIFLDRKQFLQAVAKDRMVVGDDNPDGYGRLIGVCSECFVGGRRSVHRGGTLAQL